MLNKLPNLVKNYIFIRYEDLRDDFNNTIDKFKQWLTIKRNIDYPQNIYTYKDQGITYKLDTNLPISEESVYNHPDFNKEIEKKLNYY